MDAGLTLKLAERFRIEGGVRVCTDMAAGSCIRVWKPKPQPATLNPKSFWSKLEAFRLPGV